MNGRWQVSIAQTTVLGFLAEVIEACLWQAIQRSKGTVENWSGGAKEHLTVSKHRLVAR